MNVIGAPLRGRRGYGVRRGRYPIPTSQRVTTNIFPRYQFDPAFLRPRPNSGPTSTIATASTATPRRDRYVSGSSNIPSTSRCSTGSANPTRSTPSSTHSTADSLVLIALTSGRGDARNEVGLAAIDLHHPHLSLCQISDCQTYIETLTKINILDPIEILMPETMCKYRGRETKLYTSIREKFSGLNITPIARIHFNGTAGMERVRTLCIQEYSSVELIARHKYYALAAAAALLKYVEYVQHEIYAPKSLRIEFQASPNATMIDIESARCLDLIPRSNRCIVSLLSIMDRCRTPMGRRLMRASILQPPCDQSCIVDRQSCVAELADNRSLCISLESVVQHFFGTDRLLTLASKPLYLNDVQNAERNLNYALLLKSCLDHIPELKSILAIGVHPFFVKVRENLENSEFSVMKDKISTLIHTDARFVKGCSSATIQRCFAIKGNLNELLDVSRQVYCELISDMKNMVEQLAIKHRLPLSLEHNANSGYHIHLLVPRNRDIAITDLPMEFIQARKSRRSITTTTTDLLTLNKQCKNACEEIYVMSNALLSRLLEDIRQHIGCLFQLSADVAELDLVLSLAQISSNPEYVRPSFGNRLELKNSLHPIMEFFNTDLPVPNDVEASNMYNFHLITGPNMSGKTTYLKQIVLLQIMAQMGSYVPTGEATFRVADRILCRICSRDDIELNASAFVFEMKEAQYILQSVTPKSLVVMDEMCRHTSAEEGSSIAWAICERLLLTTAFTFVATHFLHLTALSNVYYNVTTHCFETKTAEAEGSKELHLTYTHKLTVGASPNDHYGIALAEVSSLPKCVTAKAREYASAEAQSNLGYVASSSSWEKSCYDTVAKLRALLEDDRLTLANVIDVMKQLDVSKRPKPSAVESTKPPTAAETPLVSGRFANIADPRVRCKEQRTGDTEEDTPMIATTKDDSAFEDSTMEGTSDATEQLPAPTARDRLKSPKRDQESRRDRKRRAVEEEKEEEKSMEIVDASASTIDASDFTTSGAITNQTTALLLPSDASIISSPRGSIRSLADITVSQLSNYSNSQAISFQRQSLRYGNVDPLQYVSASYAIATNSQRTPIAPRGESSQESSFAVSLPSLQSSTWQYHDYCLSEKEFDITLPSQSTVSDVARMSARMKEAEIFRKIEGDAFDERAFFNNSQVPMKIDLANHSNDDNDDDVVMTS